MSSAMLDLLHLRITDRIANPVLRRWVANHTTLDAKTVEGWPVMVLRFAITARPNNMPATVIARHYISAAISKKASGPFADMVTGLVVEEQ